MEDELSNLLDISVSESDDEEYMPSDAESSSSNGSDDTHTSSVNKSSSSKLGLAHPSKNSTSLADDANSKTSTCRSSTKDVIRDSDRICPSLANVSNAFDRLISNYSASTGIESSSSQPSVEKHSNETKSGSSQIDVEMHSNDGKRIYDKNSSCLYCGKCMIKVSAHLLEVHKDKDRVIEIIESKKGSNKRRLLLEKLRLEGNFLHNVGVLQRNKGTLLILRRSSNKSVRKYSHYLPCIYYLGFVCKDQASKHMLHCKHNVSSICSRPTHQSKLILSAMSIKKSTDPEFIELVSNMRDGAVKDFIKNDLTLRQLGTTLLKKKGKGQKKFIKQKLRAIAVFALDFMVKFSETITVRELLQPSRFNDCLSLAKEKFRNENDNDKTKPITVSQRVGQYLKEAVSVVKIEAVKAYDDESIKNADHFSYLLESQWSNEINAPTLRSLHENKPKICTMPITEDLVNLSNYIESEIVRGTGHLKTTQNLSIWLSLATVVLANVIIFNRRREGEASKIKLLTYTDRPNYEEAETDLLKKSLAPSEYLLYHKYHYMTTRGKRGRPMPVVFSNHTKAALDVLVDYRDKCSIPKENEYLFANSKLGHIRGNDALHKCMGRCDVKRPDLIKSTNMRKHVATVAQVMSLNSGDIEQLSNHLGHSLSVHHQYYRLHESTIETTKIVKLLSLVNSGNLSKYKDKSIQDIEVDDVVADNIAGEIEECNALEASDESPTLVENANVASIFYKVDTPIVGRKRWDPEIKFLAKEHFKKHIHDKRPPKKEECMDFLCKHKVKDRVWKDLKLLIYNEYRKLSATKKLDNIL